jgi:hypothetical protein
MIGPAKQTTNPDRRARSPAEQAGGEALEPEHDAQVGRDASAEAANLEASPMPPA